MHDIIQIQIYFSGMEKTVDLAGIIFLINHYAEGLQQMTGQYKNYASI